MSAGAGDSRANLSLGSGFIAMRRIAPVTLLEDLVLVGVIPTGYRYMALRLKKNSAWIRFLVHTVRAASPQRESRKNT